MNLNDTLTALAVSAEMDAKSLMSKTGAQTPASDALWKIGAKLRNLALGYNLPPPHDTLEEAQRAAGIWPQEAEPATVRVKPQTYCVCLVEHDGCDVGLVLEGPPSGRTVPYNWVSCDKDGWVDAASSLHPSALDMGMRAEFNHARNAWRPVPPKPSALDEMAAHAASWAAAEKRIVGAHPGLGAAYVGVDPAHGSDAVAYMLRSVKPSNPKDAVGDTKVPLALCSPIAKAHWALAQHCGRVKYGAWNWREAGARISVYLSAIQRHADGYLSGERLDPADGTHHLGNIMACCAILLEAEAAGKLTDDRPPEVGMRCAYTEVEQQQANLTKKYADRNPKHWTR